MVSVPQCSSDKSRRAVASYAIPASPPVIPAKRSAEPGSCGNLSHGFRQDPG